MKEMNIFEREVGGRRYRIASQSVWDPVRQRPFARQAVLGPADPPPIADLGLVRTIGTQRVGDVGALVWVAEQLDLIGLIDRACGKQGPGDGPTLGEMVVAVAVQRACAAGAKCHLAAFLESCLPRVSCLPAEVFTGQAFHRLAADVTEEQLEKAQIGIARAAVERFRLSTDVLAFDTTNFDTHIATTTAGELARRGHAKSKRSDLRVVGLAILVSETGHVPLLHRTYPGNGSADEKGSTAPPRLSWRVGRVPPHSTGRGKHARSALCSRYGGRYRARAGPGGSAPASAVAPRRRASRATVVRRQEARCVRKLRPICESRARESLGSRSRCR